MKTIINIKCKKKVRTCPRTCGRTAKGQQKDINNNDNNIYLYFINKYKGSQNFGDYIKRNHKMREDPNWNLLSSEEQMELTGQL